MKHILLIIITLCVLLPGSSVAEDSIKVLMLRSPYDPLPSADAEIVDEVKGEIVMQGRSYSGYLEVMKDRDNLYVINSLPFEKYIEGVVASEIGRGREREALKAQAVISRTYAMYYKNLNAGHSWHITSSVLHQSYMGENTDPVITDTVRETNGEILTYNGLPIKAFFHSACLGKTEYPEEVWEESYPYLQSVDCNSAHSPYKHWERSFSLQTVSSLLGTGDIKDIFIISHTSSGRAKTLLFITHNTVVDSYGVEVKAVDLRRMLGYRKLPSTEFSLERKGDRVIFSGSGYGHGVGLSQWGAIEMARQGKTYEEILVHYYPGTVLKNIREPVYQNLVLKMPLLNPLNP